MALVMVRGKQVVSRVLAIIVIAPLLVNVVIRTYGWRVILANSDQGVLTGHWPGWGCRRCGGSDPLGIELAKREGLIAPLPKAAMPNLADVYPPYLVDDGYGVAFGVTAAALFFNPTKVKAPTSYADLWNPALNKRVCIIGVRNTPSAFLVIAAAAVATGKPLAEAQYLADAAWPKLTELSAPSVDDITFAPEVAKMLPYPLAKVTEMGLFTPDSANINANRSAWIDDGMVGDLAPGAAVIASWDEARNRVVRDDA